MTYLTYIAGFGAICTYFLWFRDTRLFFRTSLPGFRAAAYYGVIYAAVSLLGLLFSLYGNEFLGLGLICGALYLQGRLVRERIWTNETTLERFFGSCRCKKDKGAQ